MKHFLAIADLTKADAENILSMAAKLKSELHESLDANRRQPAHLDGKTLAMVFEKPSLRTRCAFEAGIFQMGGHAINLNASDVGLLGERESISDIARNLSQWCQLIQARVFSHNSLTELAKWATVPVINGLSDFEHPTQIFADYLTIMENFSGDLKDFHLGWIGDSFNVSNSLMVMACLFGNKMTLATPDGYEPSAKIWAVCEKINPNAKELIERVKDPQIAAERADALYTDIWVSMGQETSTSQRESDFQGYQINQELLDHSKDHTFVLHDMPAKRGKEITSDVLDGPRCKAFQQAENRLHAIKAILCWCLEVEL